MERSDVSGFAKTPAVASQEPLLPGVRHPPAPNIDAERTPHPTGRHLLQPSVPHAQVASVLR